MKFRPHFELLEARRLLASDWQNPLRIRDVDGDGSVTVLDVLTGINRLNAHSGALPPRSAQSAEPFYDVDGDSTLSPLDVLLVINALNNGPLLDVSLAKDTGTGPTGNHDRLTRDITLNGTIHGEAQQLSGRLGSTGPWIDLSKELVNGNSFVLTEAAIAKLFPESSHDGDMDFYFSAKNLGTEDAFADRIRYRFKVDRQSPVVHVLGQIQMERADEILIPLLESISDGRVDSSKIGLFDATFGENPPNEVPGEELNLVRGFVQSAQIVDSGRKLALKLEPRQRSARYRVSLEDGSVMDAAGNPVQVSGSLIANYLDPNVPMLQFERGYRTPFGATSSYNIQEFAFELPINDRIIWGGDRFNGLTERNGFSEFQIVDSTGTKVWSVKSGQRVVYHLNGSTGFYPQGIPLVAGRYRLRMIETSVQGSFFWLGRESQLTKMPMALPSAAFPQPTLDTWTLHIHRVRLAAFEGINVEKGANSESSDQRNPLWQVIAPSGRAISMDSVEQNQRFIAESGGDYIFVLRDLPYIATRIPPQVWVGPGPGTDPELGTSQVELSSQSPFGIVRYAGKAGRIRVTLDGLSVFEIPESLSLSLHNHSSAYPFDSFYQAAVSLSGDDDLILVIGGNRTVQLTLEKYVPRRFEGKIGELIESPARYPFDEYVFSFVVPTEGIYLTASNSLFSRFEDSAGIFKVAAGRYEARGKGDFIGRISSLAGDLPVVSIGQSVTATRAKDIWQLEIPASGRYEISLRGIDGKLFTGQSAIVADEEAIEWAVFPRGSLNAGRYWLHLDRYAWDSLPAGTEITLKVLPIESIQQAGEIGSDINVQLNASGLQEYTVIIPLVIGQKLFLDRSRLDPGVKLEFGNGDSGNWTNWTQDPLYPGYNFDKLWLRFSGSGSATIRLLDWAQAPFLNSGIDRSILIPPGQFWQVWKLDVSQWDNVELNIFDRIAGLKQVLLTIVDFGRIEEITGPIKFTVVNQKPIYLVISVENQLVDPLQIRYDFIRF